MKYIYEYFLEIVECKFARNGLTNWKTFLANILKNIIWHLLLVNLIKLWNSLYPWVHITEVYANCPEFPSGSQQRIPSHIIIWYSPPQPATPQKRNFQMTGSVVFCTGHLCRTYPVPVSSKSTLDSSTQPFLSPLPMSRASPPSLEFRSATSQARLKSCRVPIPLVIPVKGGAFTICWPDLSKSGAVALHVSDFPVARQNF